MAEVRCPMCGKPNDEHAEICEFCGARLKPLETGPIDETGSTDAPPSDGEVVSTGDTDWLSTIRSQATDPPPDARATEEPEEPQEDTAPAADEEEWLGRLDEVTAPASADVPPQETGLPDLSDLRPETTAEEVEPVEPTAAQPAEMPDWLSNLRGEDEESTPEPEAEFPEWLGDTSDLLAAEQEDERAPSAASGETSASAHEDVDDSAVAPDWLGDLPEAKLAGPEGPPEGDIPEWLSDAEGEPVEVPDAEEEVPGWLGDAEAAPVEDTDEDDEVPEWLSRIREKEDDGEAPLEEIATEPDLSLEDEPERTAADEPAEADLLAAAAAAGMAAGSELPDESGFAPDSPLVPDTELDSGWFKALDNPADVSTAAGESSIEPEVDEPVEAAGGTEESVEAEPAEELPHVPALIMDPEAEDPDSQIDDLDFDAIELPDWLAESQPAEQPVPVDETAGREINPDLAPATLPTWLESMRPVETLQPVIDLEPEEDQTVESVGPLAGLKGILSAEPVVAKPRASTLGATRLEVTERQYAQAELMRRMIEDEQREFATQEKVRRSLPGVRWAISLALVIAVALPIVLGIPTFPLPTRVPRDLGPLIELVNGLAVEQPALVVFDYEPGYAGELDPVSAPFLDQLMGRGIGIVTLSTRPTGPPLANQLVAEVGSAYDVENGRNYINLGYMSGGPTAIQVFAASPRDSFLQGFALPEDLEVDSVWDMPILSGVDQLSDFNSVAVITADSDNAREWIEQAEPWMGDSELIMVLSTGTEPMVRPYFEALDPQVNAILTGLPAAVAYEQVNGRVISAQTRWDSYATGVLVMEIILVLGLVYGIASVGLKYRRS